MLQIHFFFAVFFAVPLIRDLPSQVEHHLYFYFSLSVCMCGCLSVNVCVNVCVYVSLCVSVCCLWGWCMGIQIPKQWRKVRNRSWSYNQLQAAKLRSSPRTAHASNHRAISPAPGLHISKTTKECKTCMKIIKNQMLQYFSTHRYCSSSVFRKLVLSVFPSQGGCCALSGQCLKCWQHRSQNVVRRCSAVASWQKLWAVLQGHFKGVPCSWSLRRLFKSVLFVLEIVSCFFKLECLCVFICSSQEMRTMSHLGSPWFSVLSLL